MEFAKSPSQGNAAVTRPATANAGDFRPAAPRPRMIEKIRNLEEPDR